MADEERGAGIEATDSNTTPSTTSTATSSTTSSNSTPPAGWRRLGARWQVRMVVLAAIWGCSFLFIKVGDEDLAPLQVAFGRVLCGTLVLLALAVATRQHLPSRTATWGHLAVVAFFLNALPFTLFAYGETHVSAVVAGIWNATTALFTVPIAFVALRDEDRGRSRLLGMVVGFAGVVVVLGTWNSDLSSTSLEGNLLCLGAAASYAVGITYTRRFLSGRGDSPLALATGQLLVASVELACVVTWATSAPTSLPARVVGSVLALGVLGTGVAFVLSHSLIRDVGATVSSSVTFLIPVFSTIAGVVFLDEHLTWNEPVGACVILAGASLSSGLVRSAKRQPSAAQGVRQRRPDERHDAGAAP